MSKDFGPPILRARAPDGSDDQATVLKREIFACTVVTVDGDIFGAQMASDTDPDLAECAYFDKEHLGEDDKPHVKPGAMFWAITEMVRMPGRGGRPEMRAGVRFRLIGEPEPGGPGDWAEVARAAWVRAGVEVPE